MAVVSHPATRANNLAAAALTAASKGWFESAERYIRAAFAACDRIPEYARLVSEEGVISCHVAVHAARWRREQPTH